MITDQFHMPLLPQRQMRLLMAKAVEWLVVISAAAVGLWYFID